jgi:hypothetical protein
MRESIFALVAPAKWIPFRRNDGDGWVSLRDPRDARALSA